MRGKLIYKVIYLIFLVAILFCLLFLMFDKAGNRAHIFDPVVLVDYTIVDKNEGCTKGEEFLYEDNEYEYYLPCLSSYKIYLEWTDGESDLIKNALNNKKVTIESLISHGLKVNKHEK